MVVTLEVSKLSGWLNSYACCRESKGGHAVRGEVWAGRREAADDRGASRARKGRLDCRFGAGHGEGRTWNILAMVVTLEVSKLSGWLNADAPCRESKRGQGEVQALGGGRRQATAVRAAHPEHLAHACDAGGIPVGNVRIEILQFIEELAHVGDGRDAPAGDGAVLRSSGSRVGVERYDRRLQGGLGREGPGAVLRRRAGRGRRRR
eukprot:scaffold73594_cov55-Phaeocystis_antarctica.AAC.1